MNNYQEMISRITELIDENRGMTYILIGDNSSGKSEVLRKVVEKNLGQAVYFIDSVNRTFDVNKVELVGKFYKNMKPDSQRVVSDRIDPFNFNLQDTFSAAASIEQLYDKYSDVLGKMCVEFLEKELRIIRESLEAGLSENKVLLNGMEVTLSSGYQAVLRLFCEVLFFADVMQEKSWLRGLVVIDEIDEYLSPKYSAKILNYLREKFSQVDFLVTTHSLDLVECTKDAKIIVIKDLVYDVYTSQEIEDTVSADDIFTDLFFDERKIHRSDNDLTDEVLRRLLNMKIAGLWDGKAETELQELKSTELQTHQKMICRQIEEW